MVNTMAKIQNPTHAVSANVLEIIGNTPLVNLHSVAKDAPAKIYAKLEFMNPGGSIKDRMAHYIISQAEKNGRLKKGGTIVENTSGNTGIGLAMVAAVKGYKAIITIPDKMSTEKINLLKAFGVEVIVTPTDVPHDDPRSYYETAKRIAKETPDAFYVDQYNNPQNPQAHYHTTGPEIWKQTGGKIDVLVAGTGTGGTLCGVGKYLKEKNPNIKIIAVDPYGSVFYDYFKHKKLVQPQLYKVEGIGEDYLVGAMDFSVVDDMVQVTDKDSFIMARRMAREEGIFAGGSSGAAVWAALKISWKLPKDSVIVTILPDSGSRYLSKIFNDNWMAENNFL